jgi:hypothetical protein
MTIKELKELISNIPDETDVAILLSDGNLDYAVSGWISETSEDQPQTLVFSGN